MALSGCAAPSDNPRGQAAAAPDVLWRTPPTDSTLLGDEVHVWRAALDLSASHIREHKEILSTDELNRAKRFRFREDYHRYIVAHGLLRVILGGYLDTEPSQVRFVYNNYGKPSLPPRPNQVAPRFNLSHSDGLALYAFSLNRNIGIDLEHITPLGDAEALVARFFSPQEKSQYRALHPSQKREAFFACWTCKEAYIKAKGQGLSLPLDGFSVSLDLRKPAKLLDITGAPLGPARWSLHRLTASPGYAAALAVEGQDFRLACWQGAARPRQQADE